MNLFTNQFTDLFGSLLTNLQHYCVLIVHMVLSPTPNLQYWKYWLTPFHRKLLKAKGPPPAAKADEEKKKGLAMFGQKPPTPKLLRAFAGGAFTKKGFLDRLKVRNYALY